LFSGYPLSGGWFEVKVEGNIFPTDYELEEELFLNLYY
jgi:hypothetical protein